MSERLRRDGDWDVTDELVSSETFGKGRTDYYVTKLFTVVLLFVECLPLRSNKMVVSAVLRGRFVLV